LPYPAVLYPREHRPVLEETKSAPPIRFVDRYVEAAVASACKKIAEAGEGEQNSVLNYEAYGLGRLAAGRGLDGAPIMRRLVEAGLQMKAYRDPWLRRDVELKVRCGFEAGMARPRAAEPRRQSFERPGSIKPGTSR
jgi:hypothetical protein